MKNLTLYQVDAFTDQLFHGNPAAVCLLDEWIDDQLMQNISNENNLAETAFIVSKENEFEIRWFTPKVEVDLCGHATLASAFVIFNFTGYEKDEIVFNSKSGILKVKKIGDLLELDFPADNLTPIKIEDEILNCVGVKPIETFKGISDYLAVFNTETEIKNIKPDFNKVSKLNSRGLIITAPGEKVDFVSRFFAPQSGINEDPVTGSSHTSLVPYWSKRLNKHKLFAKQISSRGGILYCRDCAERTKIAGNARLYMIGEIYFNA